MMRKSVLKFIGVVLLLVQVVSMLGVQAYAGSRVNIFSPISKAPVKNVVPITYVSNGQTNVVQSVVGDMLITPANIEGVEFKGWYSDVNFTNKVEQVPASPATLYALWSYSYTYFTYDNGGASDGSVDGFYGICTDPDDLNNSVMRLETIQNNRYNFEISAQDLTGASAYNLLPSHEYELTFSYKVMAGSKAGSLALYTGAQSAYSPSVSKTAITGSSRSWTDIGTESNTQWNTVSVNFTTTSNLIRETTNNTVQNHLYMTLYSSTGSATIYIDNFKIKMNNTSSSFSPVNFNGNTNLSQYVIVKPHYATSYIVMQEIKNLQKSIHELTGFQFPFVDDADVPAGSKEIIISGTNRGSYISLSSYDNYAVTVNNDKIYLEGGNDHTTALAIREFRAMIENGTSYGITNENSMAGDYATGISKYDNNTMYRLTWADEFDGTQINTDNWYVYNVNDERVAGYYDKSCYRSDAPDVTYTYDGCLYISAKQTDDAYYGGKLVALDKMSYRYGYAEIKSVIPDGKGFWTAFWMVGDREDPRNSAIYNTEVDVNECFGDASVVAANLHRWPKIQSPDYPKTSLDALYSQKKKCFAPDGETFNDAFHTYGFEWDVNCMKFTCDGEVYFTYNNSGSFEDNECFNNYIYFIVSFAVGFLKNSLAPDSTNDWINKNKLIVDYVHLYQLAGQELTINN